jgi:ferredoxin
MGEPFAGFIAEHNPLFRKCSQDEAIAVIEKAHRRGDVHAAYFKKEFGNRLMALCNCCRCCCLGMVMWNRLKGSVPFLAPSGYVASVIGDCSACGVCVESCPFYALSIDGQTGAVTVNEAMCMGCGVCQDLCPSESLKLRKDAARGEPLDMDALLSPGQ